MATKTAPQKRISSSTQPTTKRGVGRPPLNRISISTDDLVWIVDHLPDGAPALRLRARLLDIQAVS